MWDIIGMSLSHCTGANKGVGLRHGWVCVQLLTPVIAACFDVFFNVVLCCLLMYILIIIKGNLNQPLLVTKVEFFRCSYKCLFEREKQSPLTFYSLYSHLSAYVSSPWLCCPMIHLRVAMKSQRCQRRPTPPYETLPVCSYLKISCPLDAFGPEWRTSDATQQAHQCGNERVWFFEVCDWNRRDVRAWAFRRENTVCPGASSGGPLLHLVIEKSNSGEENNNAASLPPFCASRDSCDNC